VSGSATSVVEINIPSTSWTFGDAKVTYNGPTGAVFFYGAGCGFLTDTVGTYDFAVYFNGVHDLNNLSAIPAITTSAVTTGEIQGMRMFTKGDSLQFGFDKGSDISTNPVVQIFGCGFTLYRVA
jgi:hypothetical protein